SSSGHNKCTAPFDDESESRQFCTRPEFITKSTPKGGKSKKRKIKKEEVAVEKKGRKVISKKAIKAKTEKIKQKKKEVVSSSSGNKKGNERLSSRPGIKLSRENPFFISPKSPEYASFITNSRLLIRAIIRGDSKELKRLMNSGSRNIDLNACRTCFSHADSRTADSVAILSKNDTIRQEYFRLKSQLNPGKVPRKEPNLLERKSTGQSNFYMLGRATRAVEMTRGPTYEPAADSSFGGVDALIESGIGYKEIVKLSKEPNLDSIGINVNGMDGKVVVAARMGLRELASALAEGPARCNMNDLHRETLKTGGTLPDRILGFQWLKKSYNNAISLASHDCLNQ
ncbi:hypothetical protein OSTOST_15347, partial [Ostertagia ostertagi]